MIITETVTINGKEYTRTTSDENRYVVRDGVSYAEAIDPLNSGREYTEGEYIETEDGEATAEDYEAALAEFGVSV
jgi:hypothetical protein